MKPSPFTASAPIFIEMAASNKLAEIAPAVPLPAHARQIYSYLIPDLSPLEPYQEVLVPFGPRRVPGYVIKLLASAKSRFPLKTLTPLDKPALTPRQVAFARWLARTNHGGLGYTLRLFRPPSCPSKKAITLDQAGAKARPAPTLILAPEVWMAEKIFSRLPRHTRPHAAIFHSELSSTSRAKVWRQVAGGQLDILVGTQKTLFLPWQELDFIILAEEFLPTHKLWDQYPRLDNRYGARQLAAIHGAQLYYTSSFHSMNQYFQDNKKADDSQALLVSHPPQRRASRALRSASFPPLKFRVHIIASSFEDKLHRRPLPSSFLTLLHRWQKAGDSILLLANRRQDGTFLYCSSCRKGIACPECLITLPAPPRPIRRAGKLPVTCPSCLAHLAKPACQTCGSRRLTKRSRPLANLVSILQKNGFHPASMSAGKKIPRLLIPGMVVSTTAVFSVLPDAKFDRIAWVFPELDLSYPDYRSTELALYTLARLSRHHARPRRAIELVTRRPGQVSPLSQPLAETWDKILRERRRHSYPPLTDLVKITVQENTYPAAQKKASVLRAVLDKKISLMPAGIKIHIRGPFPPAFPNPRDKPAAHLLLTGPLEKVVPLYEDLKFNTADLAPRRIL